MQLPKTMKCYPLVLKSTHQNAISSVQVYLCVFNPWKINSPPQLLYRFCYCRSFYTIQCWTDFSDSLNQVIHCFMLVLIRNARKNRLRWSLLQNTMLLYYYYFFKKELPRRFYYGMHISITFTCSLTTWLNKKPPYWKLPYSSVSNAVQTGLVQSAAWCPKKY